MQLQEIFTNTVIQFSVNTLSFLLSCLVSRSLARFLQPCSLVQRCVVGLERRERDTACVAGGICENVSVINPHFSLLFLSCGRYRPLFDFFFARNLCFMTCKVLHDKAVDLLSLSHSLLMARWNLQMVFLWAFSECSGGSEEVMCVYRMEVGMESLGRW